jgi:uncharacterized membrane protein YphA (DoxX/SURF4 family)
MADALWIVSFALCAVYLSAGIRKIAQSREALSAPMPWVEERAPRTVKVIGAAEVLGAIGLVAPWLTGVLPALTPIAASGLVVLQVLAIPVHLRRQESRSVPFNLLLLLSALFVAVLRFSEL